MRPIGHIYELEDGTFQIVNEPMPRWRLMDILLQLTRGLAAQAAEVDASQAAPAAVEEELTGEVFPDLPPLPDLPPRDPTKPHGIGYRRGPDGRVSVHANNVIIGPGQSIQAPDGDEPQAH